MTQLVYQFEWDAAKARRNQTKHGVSFKLAMSVLCDPMALTVYDEDHSDKENRWVTLGQAANGEYLIGGPHLSAIEFIRCNSTLAILGSESQWIQQDFPLVMAK